MKVTQLIVSLLPLAHAIPLTSQSVQINDPDEVAALDQWHDEAIRQYNAGIDPDTTPNDKRWVMNERGVLEERIVTLILAGFFLISSEGIVSSVTSALVGNFFFYESQVFPWTYKGNCRISYSSHAGGNCVIDTYKNGTSIDNPSGTHEVGQGCSWNEEKKRFNSMHFRDPGIGDYSVLWTASDEHLADVKGAKKCQAQGVCNPQFIFKKPNGVKIVLNTWESQGDATYCQYHPTSNCKGACDNILTGQGNKNGMTFKGKCVIPCEGQVHQPDGNVP